MRTKTIVWYYLRTVSVVIIKQLVHPLFTNRTPYDVAYDPTSSLMFSPLQEKKHQSIFKNITIIQIHIMFWCPYIVIIPWWNQIQKNETFGIGRPSSKYMRLFKNYKIYNYQRKINLCEFGQPTNVDTWIKVVRCSNTYMEHKMHWKNIGRWLNQKIYVHTKFLDKFQMWKPFVVAPFANKQKYKHLGIIGSIQNLYTLPMGLIQKIQTLLFELKNKKY